MKDNSIRGQFIVLRAKGYSYDKIADILKVSKQTLIRWSKKYELEISNFKNIELDKMKEKYNLSKKARIKIFGKILEKIKKELSTRDLTQIPADKLLSIYIMYLKHAEEVDFNLLFKKRESYEDRIQRDVLDWEA
jgi:transcriptional regulator